MSFGLRDRLGESSLHVCVDMQQLFQPGSPWGMDWTERVLPAIVELAARHAEQTVFTRFIPAQNAEAARGTWSRYYRRWAEVTLDRGGSALVELAEPLRRLVPPARLLDKRVYSPWTDGAFDRMLAGTDVDTMVITGGETDICVLATILGAIDRGYRVVVVADALCCSADDQHDALLALYTERFSEQLEVCTLEEVLTAWGQ